MASKVQRQGLQTLGWIRVVYALLTLGVAIEMMALVTGLALGNVNADYFANAKAARDAAAANSSILTQLGQV